MSVFARGRSGGGGEFAGKFRVRAEQVQQAEHAAGRGEAMAQYKLGLMYARGHGVRQDKRTAKEWFGKACDAGLQYGCDEYRKLNEAGF